MSNTVNNGIPFVPENTIDPAAGLNESLLTVDALLQLAVVSVGGNTPPSSPTNGARYIVGTAPTGAWAGRANQVAQWLDGGWRFYAARHALNTADGLVYVRQGATWSVAAAEWTAATVSQAEAEAGTATTRRAWTAERVRQAILGWWTGATSAFGRGFVAAADEAAGRTALGLGTAAATDATDYATAAQGALADTAVQPADIADVVRDEDPRLADSRAPTGAAGGVLSGSYPNPGFSVDMATQAELEAGLATRIPTTSRGAANGVASLGADGKIPESELPAIAITDTFSVASQAAMLALTAERGDIAIRTDLNKTFALAASPASTLANWLELRTPTDAVLSVAGKTGAVTLTKGDVGLGNVDNTSDATKSIGGNAATATKLATARTIGGVSFDGTANIDLPGVNITGNQDTTGTAATATLAADSSKLGGQLPAYYATAAQIGDIDAALDLINGEVI